MPWKTVTGRLNGNILECNTGTFRISNPNCVAPDNHYFEIQFDCTLMGIDFYKIRSVCK